MGMVGASSFVIISTQALQVRRPAAEQQKHSKRGNRGCCRLVEMVAGVGALPLTPSFNPIAISPFVAVPGSGFSKNFEPASCILGSSSSSHCMYKKTFALLQFEPGGKDWKRPSSARSSSSSSPSSVPPVTDEICDTIDPGLLARVSKLYRPAVILPGLGNNSRDYDVLVQSLEALEVPTTVVKVARIDWLRNAAGLFDGDYWTGKLRPRPVLNWYLNRLQTAIETAKAGAPEDRKVSLIGHSAGGWLARVYMAEFGIEDIALLLTLGTPHLPPPRGIPGVFDQTRGLLYHVEENYPGAYHPSVKYVCVAGRYLKGGGKLVEDKSTPVFTTGAGTLNLEAVESKDNTIEGDLVNAISENDSNEAEKLVDDVILTASKPENVTETRSTFRERIIGAGYKQVCGRTDVWGDGVVPEESAYLEGAVNLSLDGVYHSPVGANDSERPWYGSAGKIDQWVQYLLETE